MKTMTSTVRQEAIKWFNSKSPYVKLMLSSDFYPERHLSSLTGNEIEKIYYGTTQFHEEVLEMVTHLSLSVFGVEFKVRVARDVKSGNRVFIQLMYNAPCTKTGLMEEWKSGKHYLSEHMTEDEVVKKVYVAFEQCVKHEIMEGFKYDNIIVFNPHVNFRELLAVSHNEITRENH